MVQGCKGLNWTQDKINKRIFGFAKIMEIVESIYTMQMVDYYKKIHNFEI